MNTATTIIKSNFVNPVSEDRAETVEGGYLRVNHSGMIVALQQNQPEIHDGDRLISLEDKVITPGFIDVHLHLPQYQFLGKGLGVELLPWLETYTFPAESQFSDVQLAEAVARAFFGDLLAHGTTTASVYVTIHEKATDKAFEVADDIGIRAFIGKVMMDRNSPPALTEDTSQSVDASLRLLTTWDKRDKGRLRYVFTPRFAPTCTDDLLREVGRLVRSDGVYAQTHLSENRGEITWMESLYPGLNYTQVYERFGILGKRVIMAHCIHLGNSEVRLMTETDTRVAYCPYSNENLRSGIMPYFRWKDQGLTIGLGTDIAGGPSLSMPEQMGKAITFSHEQHREGRRMSATEAFYLATLGGAKVLGIDDVTGNLQSGKEADFIVIDSSIIGGDLSRGLGTRFLDTLVASKGNGFVDQTYVRGRQVYNRNNRKNEV
ncbi:guanine deaminase [Candidatus Woesearchaeota archaeon]|nr:guanine deaminase [Candidatus Woesearchaeota archaeon]